jgi:acyl CoA:acetate/3-ketoacid CoA transferase alpha subunit/acyl CoA:acetate/3-ketoacid CoA transferase beta subunit
MNPTALAALVAGLDAGPEPGPDRVTSVADMVRRHVQPGMTLHLSTAHCRANPLVYELIRQFRKRDPGFTVVALGLTGPWLALVQQGLVRRLVTSYCGEAYPSPAPSPLIDAAWRAGRLSIQHWSILTLPLRLLAGAMGLPWLPTRSLVGSGMESDNVEDLGVVEGPADGDGSPEDGRIATVRALVPDLSLVHGLAADRAGNVLLPAPVGEGVHGALAARRGTLVTVERIVPTEVIRRHAALTRLPASRVLAVAEAPLGAHPGGLLSPIPEVTGYAEDHDFAEAQRQAFRTPVGVAAWLEEWVMGCPDPAALAARLGPARVAGLQARLRPGAWREELARLAASIPDTLEATPEEGLVVTAARRVEARVRVAGHQGLLAGIGFANLAAWLAAYRLRDAGQPVELLAEVGLVGYWPRPADPFIFATRHLPTAAALTDILTVMGTFMGGRWSRCLGVIGAGQVDRTGAVNSTWVPGVRHLTGSGGANDVCSAAAEVLVAAWQDRGRFVERVPYVTGPGRAVRTVVSQLGVFERSSAGEPLVLTTVLPAAGGTRSKAVEAVRAACGWEVRVREPLVVEPAPTGEELGRLRLFDPRRHFLGQAPS